MPELTHPAPVTVEIDHGSTSTKDRPADRSWLVRLRRADHTVILTTGLGRTSAEHLADQINRLLHPPIIQGTHDASPYAGRGLASRV